MSLTSKLSSWLPKRTGLISVNNQQVNHFNDLPGTSTAAHASTFAHMSPITANTTSRFAFATSVPSIPNFLYLFLPLTKQISQINVHNPSFPPKGLSLFILYVSSFHWVFIAQFCINSASLTLLCKFQMGLRASILLPSLNLSCLSFPRHVPISSSCSV